VIVAAGTAEAIERARENGDLEVVVSGYYLRHSNNGVDAIAAARAIRGRSPRATLISGDTGMLLTDAQRAHILRWRQSQLKLTSCSRSRLRSLPDPRRVGEVSGPAAVSAVDRELRWG
jgi:hypothetical protein